MARWDADGTFVGDRRASRPPDRPTARPPDRPTAPATDRTRWSLPSGRWSALMGSGDGAPAESWMDRVVRLADLHRARLIRVACAYCSELWAKDCVQEAQVEIWCRDLKPDQDEPSDAQVVQWIGRVVRNKARNQRRREDVRDHVPWEDVRDLLLAADHDEVPALKEAVWEAIRQLSPAQQEVVKMWMAGYSLSEIAEETERAAGAVRSHWHRAKAKLRDSLKGRFGLE